MMAIIKIAPGDIPGTLANIEKTWKSQNPDKPFDYSFLDQDVANQYSNYQRWTKIMGYSTAIAILIACLGLFGLAGISASNRTREISIRKVFGADISSLFVMMNKEVVVLGVLSFIVATPVSWYFMSRWLNSFVYHIGLSWQIFFAAAVAGIIVAVITVSYHSIRTALVNPAEILKYE
jgi:putative ABC transport system permease protein